MSWIKKMALKVPYQIRASFVILISSFITSAIGFITTPIFARILSVEEYGLVTQFNSVLEVVTVLATLSVSAGVYQVAMNEFKEDRDSFTLSALLLSNMATVVVFAIIFIIIDWFTSFFSLPFSLVLCMFILLLFSPALNLWMARQRYEYEYKKVAIVSIVTVFFNLGVALICVLTIKGHNLGEVRTISMSVTQIISGAIIYYVIGKKAKWKPRWKYIKYTFAFNAPLIIHYLAQYVLRSSDKIMITSFCGERATGLYGLGSTVASIAMMAWSAMAASLTPYMYTHISSKEYDKVNKAVVAVIAIFGACCVVVSLIGPEVVFILGSQKYIENIQLIPPISASSLLAAIYGVYSTVAFYHHKRTSTAVMTIIAAVINILLNYILIPKYGYIAAAYTTEIAYLVYTFLHFLNYRRIVKEEKVFKDGYIWGVTIGTTIICLLTGLFYSNWLIRYSILLIIFVLAIVMRKRIIQMVRVIIKK